CAFAGAHAGRTGPGAHGWRWARWLWTWRLRRRRRLRRRLPRRLAPRTVRRPAPRVVRRPAPWMVRRPAPRVVGWRMPSRVSWRPRVLRTQRSAVLLRDGLRLWPVLPVLSLLSVSILLRLAISVLALPVPRYGVADGAS